MTSLFLTLVLTTLVTHLYARDIALLNTVVFALKKTESKTEFITNKGLDSDHSLKRWGDQKPHALPLKVHSKKNIHLPSRPLVKKTDCIKKDISIVSDPEVEKKTVSTDLYKQVSTGIRPAKKSAPTDNINHIDCIPPPKKLDLIELRRKKPLVINERLARTYRHQIKRIKDEKGNVFYRWYDVNNCAHTMSERDYSIFYQGFIEFLLFGPLLPAGGGWHVWQYVKKTCRKILNPLDCVEKKIKRIPFNESVLIDYTNSIKSDRQVLHKLNLFKPQGREPQSKFNIDISRTDELNDLYKSQKPESQVESEINRRFIHFPLMPDAHQDDQSSIQSSSSAENACGNLLNRHQEGNSLTREPNGTINQVDAFPQAGYNKHDSEESAQKKTVLEDEEACIKRDADRLVKSVINLVLHMLANSENEHGKMGVVYGPVGLALKQGDFGSRPFKDIDILFDDEESALTFMAKISQPLQEIAYSDPNRNYLISVGQPQVGKGIDDHNESQRKARRTVFINGEDVFSVEAIVKPFWMNELDLNDSQYITSINLRNDGSTTNAVSVLSTSGLALLDYLSLDMLVDQLCRYKNQQYMGNDTLKTIIYTVETMRSMEKRFNTYRSEKISTLTMDFIKKLEDKYNEVIALLHDSREIINKRLGVKNFVKCYYPSGNFQSDEKTENESKTHDYDGANINDAKSNMEKAIAKNFYIKEIKNVDSSFYEAVSGALNNNKKAQEVFFDVCQRLQINSDLDGQEVHPSMVKQFVFSWISRAAKAAPAYSQELCKLIMPERSSLLEDLINGGYINDLTDNEVYFDFDNYSNLLHLITLALRLPVVLINVDEELHKISNDLYNVSSSEFLFKILMPKIKANDPDLFGEKNTAEIPSALLINLIRYLRVNSDSYHCAIPKKNWKTCLESLTNARSLLEKYQPIRLIAESLNDKSLLEANPENISNEKIKDKITPDELNPMISGDAIYPEESLDTPKKKKKKKKKKGEYNEDVKYQTSDLVKALYVFPHSYRDCSIKQLADRDKRMYAIDLRDKILEEIKVHDEKKGQAPVNTVNVDLSKCGEICRKYLQLADQLGDSTACIILGMLQMQDFDRNNRDFKSEAEIIRYFRRALYRGNPQGSTCLFMFAAISGRSEAFSASLQSSRALDSAIGNDRYESIDLKFLWKDHLKNRNQKIFSSLLVKSSLPIQLMHLVIKKQGGNGLSPQDHDLVDSLYAKYPDIASRFTVAELSRVSEKIYLRGEEKGCVDAKKADQSSSKTQSNYIPCEIAIKEEKYLKEINTIINFSFWGNFFLQTGNEKKAEEFLLKASIGYAQLTKSDCKASHLAKPAGLSSFYQASKIIKNNAGGLEKNSTPCEVKQYNTYIKETISSITLHHFLHSKLAEKENFKEEKTLDLDFMLDYLQIEGSVTRPRYVTYEQLTDEISERQSCFDVKINDNAVSYINKRLFYQEPNQFPHCLPSLESTYSGYSVDEFKNVINKEKLNISRKVSIKNKDKSEHYLKYEGKFVTVKEVLEKKYDRDIATIISENTKAPLLSKDAAERYMKQAIIRLNGLLDILENSRNLNPNNPEIGSIMKRVYPLLNSLCEFKRDNLYEKNLAEVILKLQVITPTKKNYSSACDEIEDGFFSDMISLVNPQLYRDISEEMVFMLFTAINFHTEMIVKNINNENKFSLFMLLHLYLAQSQQVKPIMEILSFVIKCNLSEPVFIDLLKRVLLKLCFVISQTSEYDDLKYLFASISRLMNDIKSEKRSELLALWQQHVQVFNDKNKAHNEHQEQVASQAYDLLMQEEQCRILKKQSVQKKLDDKYYFRYVNSLDEKESSEEGGSEYTENKLGVIEDKDDKIYRELFNLFKNKSYKTFIIKIKEIEGVEKNKGDTLFLARIKILKTEMYLKQFADENKEINNFNRQLKKYIKYRDAYREAKQNFVRTSDDQKLKKSVFPKIEKYELFNAVEYMTQLTDDIDKKKHPLRLALAEQEEAIDILSWFILSPERSFQKLSPIKEELDLMIVQHDYLLDLLDKIVQACTYLEHAFKDQQFIVKHLAILKQQSALDASKEKEKTEKIQAESVKMDRPSRAEPPTKTPASKGLGSSLYPSHQKQSRSSVSVSQVASSIISAVETVSYDTKNRSMPLSNFFSHSLVAHSVTLNENSKRRGEKSSSSTTSHTQPHSSRSQTGKSNSVNVERVCENKPVQRISSRAGALAFLQALKDRITSLNENAPDTSRLEYLLNSELFKESTMQSVD